MLLCGAGWVGGIITLLLFFAITLWSSLLLTECHETGGMKHPTYRSAVLHILGKQRGACGKHPALWLTPC
jgi:amino acid permease